MLADAIDPDAKKMWRVAGTTGAVGIEIVLAVLVGYLGGQWLDRHFGTGPWLKWVGLVAGVGAAIKALMRVVRQYNKSLDQQDDGPDPKNG
jgi:F0F1-type ATP synthase assembly protein I